MCDVLAAILCSHSQIHALAILIDTRWIGNSYNLSVPNDLESVRHYVCHIVYDDFLFVFPFFPGRCSAGSLQRCSSVPVQEQPETNIPGWPRLASSAWG
jgi:hypothetical protein